MIDINLKDLGVRSAAQAAISSASAAVGKTVTFVEKKAYKAECKRKHLTEKAKKKCRSKHDMIATGAIITAATGIAAVVNKVAKSV